MSTIPQPINPDSVRPFRLWDANAKAQLRLRYYADKRRAHNAALVETRWAAVGVTIEVFDVRTAKLLGQYTRRPTTVTFVNGTVK